MEPFVGQVLLFAGNFAPRGWALCNGQQLLISKNTALFSILGTTFGGDGSATFALPDLRGRVAVNPGQGSGLAHVKLGQRFGKASTNLANTSAMTSERIDTNSTAGGSLENKTKDVTASQKISIIPAALGMNYIIALKGSYPSRS